MPASVYPATLPSPDVAPMSLREVRAVQGEGPYRAGAQSVDLVGTQELSFTFTGAESQTFWTWWSQDLQYGGRWFRAEWPHPDAAQAHEYQFSDVPRQDTLADPRRISATVHVRDSITAPQANAQPNISGAAPTMLAAVHGASYSEAAAEAMAVAEVDRVLLDCLSFTHPLLAGGVHVVADYQPFSATLETGTQRIFQPCALAVKDLDMSESGTPTLTISFEGISGQAAAALRTACKTVTPLIVEHRVYVSDQPTAPARLPVTRLEVVEVTSVTRTTVQLRAQIKSAASRAYPARRYTRDRYPGLAT